MNYLNSTDVGGMFLHADDLRFLHAAYADCFSNLCQGLAPQDYKLFGSVVADTGNGFYAVTDGAVVIDGEICKVEAHSIPNVSGQTPYWIIEETDDPAGVEEFKNNVTNSTYKIRKGIIVSSATPPADYSPADMKTLRELLAESVNTAYNITNSFTAISTSLAQINQRLGVWQDFTPIITSVTPTSTYPSNFRYRHSVNTLYLNCHFTYSIGTGGLASFSIDLPAGLKSNSVLEFNLGSGVMGFIDNVNPGHNRIEVNTSSLGVGAYRLSFSITIETQP